MTRPDPTLAAVPLPPAQFRAAIAAVLLLILLGALDQMCVSVALPTIGAALGGLDGMAWVISGYMLAATVVTPLYGKFGDMHGRRPVLVFGLVLFLLGSVGSALAGSLGTLVLARVLQGAGAGGIVALSQGVVADIVPMRDRGRYQGYISILWAVASMIGPVAGGLVTQYLSWRWLFWVNLPLCVLAWVLVARSLRALPTGHGRQAVDWTGSALLMAGLVCLLLPITRMGQGVPVIDLGNDAWLVAAVVLLAVFWWQQQRAAAPVLPPSLLHNRAVRQGIGALFICFFIMIALTLIVPLRLQLVAGMDAAQAGSFLMWLTLSSPAAVFLSGRWLTRTGRVRPPQQLGAALVPIGLVAFALVPPSQPWATAAALVVLGAGLGQQIPTTMLMVQNAVAQPLIGTATALVVLFRSLGGAIGIAVLSSIIFGLLQGGTGLSVHGLEELAHGGAGGGQTVSDHAFQVALFVAAALGCVSVWISWRLPDTRLHGGRAGAQAAAAE